MSPDAEQKPLRLFYAVALSEEAVSRAAAHAASLRVEAAGQLKVGWERAEKLHVTMKFLGDVPAPRVGQLSRAAERVASRYAPFHATLEGCGVFPSRGRPHVLWLGVARGADTLDSLQRDLADECAREGFPREARPFHPHVTIARLRSTDAGARGLASLHLATGFGPVEFGVTEFVLMRSELGAGGSVYTPLARYELKVGGGG
jgi:2'-5' RNA ligase